MTNSPIPASNSFEQLGLCPSLCKATEAAGYPSPTPIQLRAIPRVLSGKDLLACARTGSGKTAAFALPILEQLLKRKAELRAPSVLVLAPTRELASQIGEWFGRYAVGSGISHLVIYGGVGKTPQVAGLRRRPDVIVACPGRLLDLMREREVDLKTIEFLVLDEADRMLDMGFIHDVRKIVAALPRKRQNLLFSATMPREIEILAKEILQDPVRVDADPVSSTPTPIDQSVFLVHAKEKAALLTHLLADVERALVFTKTKHGANRVAERLVSRGIGAMAIHGNKSMSARERALNGFKDGSIKVVVATDLASRGIDVKDISHVINYDLPDVPETYVHRIGRTGRAGASGIAISLVADEELHLLRSIERLTKNQIAKKSLEGIKLPQLPELPPSQRDRSGPPRRGPAPAGQRTGAPGGTPNGEPSARKKRPRRPPTRIGIRNPYAPS